jgi:hypothetical protein
VSWHKASGKWQAQLTTSRGKTHLSRFDSEEEAAKAVERAREAKVKAEKSDKADTPAPKADPAPEKAAEKAPASGNESGPSGASGRKSGREKKPRWVLGPDWEGPG